jgi:N-acetylmuramoyl-L-alanine amidase
VIKIGLDCGHGLRTKGKETPNGIKEFTLNDKVRDKVVYILEDYDVEIIHTDNNEGYTDESLSSRLTRYKSEKVDAFVSIHHNAFGDTWNNATGVEVYVDKKATSEDVRLAQCVYDRLVKYTGLKGRGIKKENFYVINQNTIPAILVEGEFMTNKANHKYITSEAGQTAYAKAVAEGLIEFLKLKKKPLSPTKSLDDWAKEVIAGKHGNGHTNREKSLKKSGCAYSYAKVRARVNELLK